MKTKRSFQAIITDLGPYALITLLGFYRVKMIAEVYGIEVFGLTQIMLPFFVYLNVLELGFSSVVTYNLYQPFLTSNFERVNAILNGAKIIFDKIGRFIIASSVVIALLMPYFLNASSIENTFIAVVFILYVASNFIKYFIESPYKFVLLADQRQFQINIITNGLRLVQYLIEIVLILLSVNFMIVMFLSVSSSVLISFFIRNFALKKYSWFDKNTVPEFSCLTDLKSISYHRISGIILAVIPGLIIAYFFDLKTAAIYGAINLIFIQITVIIDKLLNSIRHSYGTMFIQENNGESQKVFYEILSFTFVLATVVSIVFFVSIKPFIGIWLNNPYISVSNTEILLFTIYLYGTIIKKSIHITHDVNRLYTHTKYYPVFEVIIVAILSLIFIRDFGLSAVLLANVVANYLIGTLLIARVILSKLFGVNMISFFKIQLGSFIMMMLLILMNIYTIDYLSLFDVNSFKTWVVNTTLITLSNIVIAGILYFVFSHSFRGFVSRICNKFVP